MRARGVVIGVAGIALCAWCGWVSGYHRASVAAETTWGVSLGAVLLADFALWREKTDRRLGWHLEPVRDPWPRVGRGGPGPALRGVAPWLALFVVALAWDVLGIDTGPRQYHLTASALAQAYRPLNAALLLLWMVVGIGYAAARVRAPVLTVVAGVEAKDPPGPERGTALAAAMGSLGHHGAPALLLPSSPPVGVAFWVAVPLVAVLIDMVARRSDGRQANAEEFVRFISTSRLANVALIVAWGFAGYHLFAR